MNRYNIFYEIVQKLKCFFASLGSRVCSAVDRSSAAPKGSGSGGKAQKDAGAKAGGNIFSMIWNTVTWLIVIAAVALALMLVGVRVFGLTPYCVLSGSMEPMYKTGSLIYVKQVEPENVSIGDAITFVLNEDLVVATHQVYRIDRENRCFYTQGIANIDSEGNIQHDPSPVLYENLVGKPVFTIPKLGYVSEYLSAPPGMYVGIGAAIALLFLFFVPDLLKKADESDRSAEQADDSRQQRR